MSNCDKKYQLKGFVEFGKGFFERADKKYTIKEKESEATQESTFYK